jgi:hypothetical protein
MADRRPLVAGLSGVGGTDPGREKQFVFGDRAENEPAGRAPANVSRVPLTTRVRADYGAALKRASLERQLSGQAPNTVQEILEEALGPWLRANGYVP